LKKKNILVLILLVALSSPLNITFKAAAAAPDLTTMATSSSTNVSGYITTNTTWTLAGSPYIVVGDVIVVPDVFLTIEPGVVVRFTAGTSLIIDGGLFAQGTSTHKITFTSNSMTPAIGDWGSINIRHYSTGANRLSHVRAEYASTALALAANCNITYSSFTLNNNGISLNAGKVYIDHDNVANNAGTGIGGSISQSIEIKNSEISMNGAGMTIGGDYPEPSLYMKNCTVSRNAGSGVRLGTARAEVDNCTISANGRYGYEYEYGIQHGGYSGYLKLYNSNVSNNKGTGLGGGYAYTDVLIDVRNSTFLNNTNGLSIGGTINNCTINKNHGYGVSSNYMASGVTIRDSIIRNNGNGLYLEERESAQVFECDISNNTNGIVCGYESGASVYSTIIRNNSESGVRILEANSGLRLYDSIVEHNLYGVYGAVGLYGIYGYVYALGSTIRNNTVGVLAWDFEASYTTIANNSLVNVQNWREGWEGGTCTLEYCSVHSSLVGIQLKSGTIRYSNIYNHKEYNIKNMASNEISATCNWWDTTDETLIQKYIYDYYDDYNLGMVLYKPYLTELVVHDICVSEIETPKTIVGQGYSLQVNVTAVNEGNVPISFDLIAYANTVIIGSQTVLDLFNGSSITITFIWSTAGHAKDDYTISAYATPVACETDMEDNTYTDGAVLVTIPGDVNGDKGVNILDAGEVNGHWYVPPAPPPLLGYDPNVDINNDRKINILDAGIVNAHWLQSW